MARAYESDGRSAVRVATPEPGLTGALRRMSWGAVLGGAVIMLVIQLLLAILGIGIGLTSVNPAGGDNPSPGTFTLIAGLYWVACAVFATFAGASAAGRLAGIPDRTDGMLHGIIAWSVATLLLFYLLTSSVGSLVGGALNGFGGAIKAVGQSASGLASGAAQLMPDQLKDQANQLFAKGQQAAQNAGQQAQQAGQQAQQATGTNSTPDALRRVVAGVKDGASPEDRQAAVNAIAQQAGIPPEEADKRLNDFQNSYRQTVAEAKDTAQKAKEGLSKAAYWSFAALLLGLIVAAWGGANGTPRDEVWGA